MSEILKIIKERKDREAAEQAAAKKAELTPVTDTAVIAWLDDQAAIPSASDVAAKFGIELARAARLLAAATFPEIPKRGELTAPAMVDAPHVNIFEGIMPQAELEPATRIPDDVWRALYWQITGHVVPRAKAGGGKTAPTIAAIRRAFAEHPIETMAAIKKSELGMWARLSR